MKTMISPAAAARLALNAVLKKSIEERAEYGGVIYRAQGGYAATDPRTQGYGNTVDVGLREENKGCPPGTTPVAYYHTHPNLSAGPLPMAYNEFKGDDVEVAEGNSLDGFLGTIDGSFFKYDFRSKKLTRLSPSLKNSD